MSVSFSTNDSYKCSVHLNNAGVNHYLHSFISLSLSCGINGISKTKRYGDGGDDGGDGDGDGGGDGDEYTRSWNRIREEILPQNIINNIDTR